jgi:hypothetical protein
LALALILWSALGETETEMMAEFWRLDNPLLPDFKARSGLEAGWREPMSSTLSLDPGPMLRWTE